MLSFLSFSDIPPRGRTTDLVMNSFKQQLISIRRKIHKYPELGNHEFRTTALIEKVLKNAGIKTHRITKTGVIGIISGEKKTNAKKKTFAIRADIDALPIKEKTDKTYASARNGIMHACGHDANSTMVLGGALMLSRQRRDFSGTVKAIFQPNEESSGGADAMIKAGALKNPRVDAIVGIHVNPWLPAGVLGVKPDQMMAAVDRFSIEIVGEGGHGAYPHLGKDAIVAASSVVIALQTVVSREIDPVNPCVITIGTIHGGERFNILCGSVKLVGTVRTLDEKLHKSMRKLIEQKVRNITKAFGTSYKLDYEELGSPLRNSNKILEICRLAGELYLGKNSVRMLEKPSMGGEDFAEYLRHVPGCFIYLGARKGKAYPWHHEKFNVNEDILPIGAELIANIAKRYLS